MAFVRGSDGQPLRNADGTHRVQVTEAQARANEAYRARKKAQHEALLARQEARAQRTPEEQLAVLDERLGKGVGATRERARLQKQLEAKAD